MTITEAKEAFRILQEKMAAYNHAISLILYDAMTAAPRGTVDNRVKTLSVLTEEDYKLRTGKETVDLFSFLNENEGELTAEEKRELNLLLHDFRQKQAIPMDEYVAYTALIAEAEDVWHTAKENSDFALFEPYLTKIFDAKKRFARYIAPDKAPYDYWLGEYETGLTQEIADRFFAKVRARLVPLIKKIQSVKQVDDSFLYGVFPNEKQRALSPILMEKMGLDFDHVALAEAEHPFTEMFGSHRDERITTHYYENYFVSSMYSVIHEGGHALYDMGTRDEYAFTALDGGVSMGIHESQSRFYENLIGRSRPYCEMIYPTLCELFPTLREHTADEFYRAVNKAEPSLIRTEADEITYCLHVMVRYEIEKRVMADELSVHDLPDAWNALYREYLGVEVPNDRMGLLQDSHWAGGDVGYFPSYALGSAYGAQFLNKMKETVDVDGAVRAGDMTPINEWNREHIWQYGQFYTPKELLDRVLGEDFDPDVFLTYLENKAKDVYRI